MFLKAYRNYLANNDKYALDIINKYLPKQMTVEEVEESIKYNFVKGL
jgi:uncharacterized protein YqeY